MANLNSQQTKNGPLLYIIQPDLACTTGKMQQNLVLRKNKKVSSFNHDGVEILEKKNVNVKAETKAEINGIQKEIIKASEEPVLQVKENEEPRIATKFEFTPEELENNNVVTGIRKPFREMDIDEKLYFLTHRPLYIPKAPCEIRTDSQSYFGNVDDYNEQIVYVKILNDTQLVEVKKNEILNIRLLGI